MVHSWQTIGIAHYTQLDNEGCFSGGATHPYVLGKVVRLALSVGTEVVFSPVYHPQSNGYIERFHQDYNRHVWQATYLPNRQQVQQKGEQFFQAYRQSEHHSALNGLSPHLCHYQIPERKLSPDFVLPTSKIPLSEGRIHFIRRVLPDNTVSILNVRWAVPNAYVDQGLWATLELKTSGALLSIFDAAPDVLGRRCLGTHPFPLKEPVLPRTDPTHIQPKLESHPCNQIAKTRTPDNPVSKDSPFFLVALIAQSARFASRLMHTMF